MKGERSSLALGWMFLGLDFKIQAVKNQTIRIQTVEIQTEKLWVVYPGKLGTEEALDVGDAPSLIASSSSSHNGRYAAIGIYEAMDS